MKYIIQTDGGARGNPGLAACAYIVKSEKGKVIKEEGLYLGVATNNEAEYSAVLKALEYIASTSDNTQEVAVKVKADSQLIVNQLSNRWKIKNQNLKTLHSKIKELEKKIRRVDYKYISREENKEADLLVNITLDSETPSL